MSYRNERINELIKNELNLLIEFQIRDPRIKEQIVSVVRVKTTPDLKYSKVYVSVMEEDRNKKLEVLQVLETAKGFLRKEISKILNTRYTPSLVFELDESLDYAMHIEDVLRGIDKKEGEK